MMRSHGEHQIGVADEITRERLRPVLGQVKAPLDPDEQRPIGRRRADSRH